MAPDDSPFSSMVASIGQVYSYIPMPFPPELRADLREMVAHGSHAQVATAAIQLSMHGLPEDEAVLKKRLAAIEADLKLHPEKIDNGRTWGETAGLMSAENALMGALRQDEVWHPTQAELISLKQDCLGAFCQQVPSTPSPPVPAGH
jgi:hypothetical protein